MANHSIPIPQIKNNSKRDRLVHSLSTLLFSESPVDFFAPYHTTKDGAIIDSAGGLMYEADDAPAHENKWLCELMNRYGAHDWDIYEPIIEWLRETNSADGEVDHD